MVTKISNEHFDNLAQSLADEGKLVEAGWVAMFSTTLKDADPVQIAEMRKAYFAGAQHLFSSIIGLVDESAGPSDQDIRRMDSISEELKYWVEEIRGSAAHNEA